MPRNDISADDRDLMVRTILGEAANEGADGQAAVAHSILNRLSAGRYGKTPGEIVMARGQYEPWSTRSRELLSYSPESPPYKAAAKVLDGVISGDIPDPTGGATHFLNSDVVRARRGGSLPAWAQGDPTATIGNHAFYAPEGRAGADQDAGATGAINSALGAQPTSVGDTVAQILAFQPEDSKKPPVAASPPVQPSGSLFKAAGFDVPAAPQAAPVPQQNAPAAATPTMPASTAPGSLFSAAGFALPGAQPPAAPQADPNQPAANIPTPERFAAGVQKYGVNNVAPPRTTESGRPLTPLEQTLESISNADPMRAIASNIAASTKDSATNALALGASGIADLKRGILLPHGTLSDPSTWAGGGLLKTAGAGLGYALAPLTGATNALVTDPVTKLTGSPETGERAGFLAGAILPGPKVAAAAKAVTPTSKAVNALVDMIGPENVPAIAARLRANPRLAIMDASDPVRVAAQGMIDPAQPAAQNLLSDIVKKRIASAPTAVNAAYTDAMGAAPDVVKTVADLKKKAQDVGSQMIQPVIAGTPPVDITGVIASLDKTIGLYALKALQAGEAPKLPMTAAQQTAWDLRQRLRGGLPDRDTMFMDAPQAHELQSQLRYEASQMSSSAAGSERLTGGQIGGVRGQLVDAIDEASGGNYKPALAKYRDAKMVQEAFESGFDTLKNRSGVAGLEDRPEAFQQWVNNASPEEIAAKRLGTRADIDQKINGVRFAAKAGTDIPDVAYNQQKLAALFGDDEAKRLIKTLNDERDIATTNSKLLANSKTAETLAGQNALAVPDKQPFSMKNPMYAVAPSALGEIAAYYAGLPMGLVGPAMLGSSLALGGASKLGNVVSRASAATRNLEFARLASATGETRDAVINRLISHPKVIRQLNKPSNALTIP